MSKVESSEKKDTSEKTEKTERTEIGRRIGKGGGRGVDSWWQREREGERERRGRITKSESFGLGEWAVEVFF